MSLLYPSLWISLALLVGCTPTEEPEPEPEPAWGEGERTLSGNAYFFTMETFGDIQQVTDLEGAEVYLVQEPEIRQTLDPADGHGFVLTGIPNDVEITLALVHPDYFRQLTATFQVGSEDLENINFQSTSHEIIRLSAGLFDVDVEDESKCHMVTTVTAISDNQDLWWAVGEPGATVTVTPAVDADAGPIYFNTSVLPDLRLTETSDDGGVAVFGVDPGRYRWEADKPGFSFDALTMDCVGGWVTNGVPPRGMQAHVAE
jgi:hypothetical protein